MKKSLIALAVASAVSAPAFAATSNVDVYGRMAFSVDYVDSNDVANDADDIVTGRDNISRIGFKGTEDLGGGLAAVWQIETQLSTAAAGTLNTANTIGSRNTFVGLKSDAMGTVVMGRHDTPYKLATGSLDIFADTAGDYNTIIGTTSAGTIYDTRANQTVAYISPTWSGFHFAAAYVEVKLNEGAGANNADAMSAMGMYNNGPIFASVAYETYSGAAGGGSTAIADTEAFKVGFGLKMGDFKLGAVYEDISSDVVSNVNSRDAYYVNAMFSIGAFDLKAAYGISNDGESVADTEFDYYALGADYNLSKRTKLFAVYSTVGNALTTAQSLSTTGYAATAGQDMDVISLGVIHNF